MKRRMDAFTGGARFAATSAAYARAVKGFLCMGFTDVPMIPICRPTHDVAMQKYIGG